jgi:uncharacterized protein YjiK
LKYTFIIIYALLYSSCQTVKEKKKIVTPDSILVNYNFNKPDAEIELPDVLHEISGISIINDTLIAAISDDKPYLFIYNLQQQKITNKIKINSGYDFEDISICGNDAYILQSNGTLWIVTKYASNPVISSVKLPLENSFELEGLCRNNTNDTLFIAAKYWQQSNKENKHQLPVWAYSIGNKTIQNNPVFIINSLVSSKNIKQMFRTAGIVKLYTQNSWLAISTNDKFIITINAYGNRQGIVALNEDLFTQPEGIDIDTQNNIYICNEAKNGRATILKFNKKKL